MQVCHEAAMGPIRELGPAALLSVKAEDVRALEEKVRNRLNLIIDLVIYYTMFVLYTSTHLMGCTFIFQLHDILLQCHSHPFYSTIPEKTVKIYHISSTSNIATVTL